MAKMTKAVEKAVEKAFNRLNIIGTDADIYSVLYSYKALRELSESELDEIYNELVRRLGF